MMKRTLWFVVVVVLCCCLGVVAVSATQANRAKAAKATAALSAVPAQTTAAEVTPATPAKAPAKAEVRTSGIPTSGQMTSTPASQATTDGLADRLAPAKAAYERWLATGTASPAEKALMDEYIFSQVPHGNGNPLDATGGPDAYGYRYVDNQAPDTEPYSWIELSGDPNATNVTALNNMDDTSTLINFGMSFPFYGTNYTSCYMNSDGYLAFNNASVYYSNVCLPYSSFTYPVILPYWDDLYGNYGGLTTNMFWWRNFGTYTVFEWDSVGHCCSPGSSYKFEAILYANGDIKFQYNNMAFGTNTLTATVGIQGSAANYLQYNCNSATNDAANGRAVRFYIQAITGVDLRATNLAPCGNNPPNPTQQVSMRVTNWGTTASPATTARFSFDGVTNATPAAVGALAPGAFQDITFANTVNLTVGAHALIGHVNTVAGEAATDTSNNTQSCTANGFACYDATADLNLGPYSNTAATTGDDCTLRTGTADYVYRVVIPHQGQYTFQLCGTAVGFDSYLYLSDACCAGTVIASNDDSPLCTNYSLLSNIPCQSLAAGTYYLDVENYSGTGSNTFTVNISECAPCLPVPANDACTAAGAPATLPATFTGNNECATHDCSLLTAGQGETWHAFTIPSNYNVDIDYCTTPGNWGNFYIVVAEGCPCSNYIVCNNYETTTCAPNITMHFVNLPGGTYYIPVLFDSTMGARGAYTIHVSGTPYEAPAGDVCATAIPITVPGSVDGTTVGATNDYDAVCPYTGSTSPDKVYSYTPSVNQDVTFSLCTGTTNYDTKLYIYAGTCGSGEIACNDDFCSAPLYPSSFVSYIECVPLTAGVTYYIVVDGYGASSGNYTLVTTTCLPCVVDQQAGDIVEPVEPWPVPNDYATNDPDGGCLNTVPTYGPALTLGGAAVFGKTFLYIDPISGSLYRDTDWYPFTVTTTTYVTATAVGELAVQALIVSQPCPGVVLAGATAVHSCSLAVASACLTPGTYWLFIGGTGTAASTDPVDYRAWLTTGTCPTGRCCYGDPSAPLCQDVIEPTCAGLGGSWDPTLTCATPCPVHLGCTGQTGTILVSQAPYNDDEAWAGVTSEESQSYIVAENFSVTGPIGLLRFWGLDAAYNAGWAACDEDPMPFHVSFHADNGGIPADPATFTYEVTLTRTATTETYLSFPLWQYDAVLSPACTMTSGWLEIQGAGLSTCWFLWAASPDGDAIALQYNAGTWSNPGYGSMAMCLATGCDASIAPINATAYMSPDGVHPWIHFNAPVAGDYRIYSTTLYQGAFDPLTWTLETTLTNAPAGANNWTDPAAVVPFKRYAVTHNCP